MSAHTTEIDIKGLSVNTDLQPRINGLDPAHVAQLQQVIDDLPPMKVVPRGDDFFLVDGFHRFAALQNLGRERVAVEFVDTPSDGDLRGLAFVLNATHGRPLSLDDRRAEAGRVLYFDPSSSDREIGRHCGLSQPTIAKIRAELEATAQIERTTERVGKGGYRYDVDQSHQVDDVTRLRKSFERFFIYVANGVESEWWDETAIVEMLLNTCDEDQLDELLEALKDTAAVFASVAQVFETAIS